MGRAIIAMSTYIKLMTHQDYQLDEDKREGDLLQMNRKRHVIKGKPFFSLNNLSREIVYIEVDNTYLISYYLS